MDHDSAPEQPHLASPIVERIVTMMVVLASLTLIFVILRQPWGFQTQPIDENIRLGCVKSLAIFSGAMSMAQGLDSLIRSAQIPSSAGALDFGIFATVLLTLYGPTKMLGDRVPSLEELHDIVKHFVLGLLFLTIMVNSFVTVPFVYPPLVQMALIAAAATIFDALLSLIPENWNAIRATLVKYA